MVQTVQDPTETLQLKTKKGLQIFFFLGGGGGQRYCISNTVIENEEKEIKQKD